MPPSWAADFARQHQARVHRQPPSTDAVRNHNAGLPPQQEAQLQQQQQQQQQQQEEEEEEEEQRHQSPSSPPQQDLSALVNRRSEGRNSPPSLRRRRSSSGAWSTTSGVTVAMSQISDAFSVIMRDTAEKKNPGETGWKIKQGNEVRGTVSQKALRRRSFFSGLQPGRDQSPADSKTSSPTRAVRRLSKAQPASSFADLPADPELAAAQAEAMAAINAWGKAEPPTKSLMAPPRTAAGNWSPAATESVEERRRSWLLRPYPRRSRAEPSSSFSSSLSRRSPTSAALRSIADSASETCNRLRAWRDLKAYAEAEEAAVQAAAFADRDELDAAERPIPFVIASVARPPFRV